MANSESYSGGDMTPDAAWELLHERLQKAAEDLQRAIDSVPDDVPPKQAKPVKRGKRASNPKGVPDGPERDRDGIPLREKFSINDIPLSTEATSVLTICLDELRKYMEVTAAARTSYLGGCEVTPEDILSSMVGLQFSMTVGRIVEQVSSRLIMRG